MMDFSPSEDQRSRAGDAAQFARALNAGLAERDQCGEFSRDGWQQCADFGILGLVMPEAYGGRNVDALTATLIMEGLGAGCQDNGLLFALGAQMWSVQVPILLFGSDDQKQRYLPSLIGGRSIGAHSVTEPGAGSDIYSLQTQAVRDGDEYVLTGKKTFVTGAPLADLFLVLATVDRSLRADGLTAFLIEKGTPGLATSAVMEKMGLRTAAMGEVTLDGCRVPAGQMLGQPGGGAAVLTAAMEWERAFILAPALGSMQRQLEQCLRHARARRQFDRPIGKHQAVADKLVAMHLRLETSRLLTYRTAWLKRAGKRLTREPSEVKLHVSESWVQTCLDALQIHGATGYLVITGIERDLRDALASKIYSGTSEIQKVIIARFLGL